MNEIYLYGEIMSESFFFDEVITPKQVREFLQSASGEVKVHLNSIGGEIFAALAISNMLKNYSGGVEILIEGICASAATIIACGAKKVTMAQNAIYMTHAPRVYLDGYKSLSDLAEFSAALSAMEKVLLKTYAEKMQVDESSAEKLLATENWYTAEEALAAGLIDSIGGEFIKQEENQMTEQNLLAKLKNILSAKPILNQTSEARTKEVERFSALNKLRGENSAANAMIDLAIKEGDTADQIEKYLNCVKNQPSENDKIISAIAALIEDNMQSGAEKVEGVGGEIDAKKSQAEMIAKFANGGR